MPMEFSSRICKENIDLSGKLALYWPLLFTLSHIIVCMCACVRMCMCACVCVCVYKREERSDFLNI